MTFKKLCLAMCKAEGGKQQINIAQMREAMSKLRKLIRKNPSILILLLK